MPVSTSNLDLSFSLRQPFVVNKDTIGGIANEGNRKSLTMLGLDGQVPIRCELSDDFRFPIGVDDSELWLAFDDRLERRTMSGDPIADLSFPFESGERRIGLAGLSNGEILAAVELLKAQPKHGLSGELYRIQKDGEVVWGSVLKVDRIDYEGCVAATAKNGFQNLPKPAWKPKTWVTDWRFPILVSGNHVFASWQESPRSGIGKHYAVRLADGHPVAITRPLPVSWTHNLEDGRVLVSAGGYGACQSVRLDPVSRESGMPDISWPTHGRFFQSPAGKLFCVEMFHGSPRNAHVVRLGPNGSTEKIGEPLPGFHTSQPRGLGDERFCFWRGNQVWVCHPVNRSLESVASTSLGDLAYAQSLQLASNKVAILVYRNSRGPVPAKCQVIVIEGS